MPLQSQRTEVHTLKARLEFRGPQAVTGWGWGWGGEGGSQEALHPGLTQEDDGLPPGAPALFALRLPALQLLPLGGQRALLTPRERPHHTPAHEGHGEQDHEVDDEGTEDAGLEHGPAAGQVGTDGHVGALRLLVVAGTGAVARETAVTGHVHQGVLDSHGKKQRQRHQGGGDPDEGNQQLHLAGPRHGLVPEGVADGDVALEAERQHVQQRGVAAGLEEERVKLAGHGVAGLGQGIPDDAVELHGHADEEDQDVGASQAHHVIRHLLLQVALLLQHLGDPNGDAIPQDAHHEDGQVHQDEGDFDPGGHLEPGNVAVIDDMGAVTARTAGRSHEEDSRPGRGVQRPSELPFLLPARPEVLRRNSLAWVRGFSELTWKR